MLVCLVLSGSIWIQGTTGDMVNLDYVQTVSKRDDSSIMTLRTPWAEGRVQLPDDYKNLTIQEALKRISVECS